MSFFFGGGKKTKPQYTGLQTQTSTSNLPVPLVAGKTRIAPNIIWQGDFKAHKKKVKAGKGGPKQTTYTYSGSFQLGLCIGPINDVTRMWKDQSKKDDYADVGMILFTGTVPQAPWGFMVSNHPAEALGYSGTAHLDVPNYDLGQSNTLGQHSFEVEALHFDTQVGGNGDADPAVWIEDFLTNVRYGVPIDGSILGNLLSTGAAPTTGDNTYQTYCQAMGFGLSPALSSQETANGFLDKWTKLTNTAIVSTGYAIKFFPYGDQEVTGNGVHYIPVNVIRYYLSDSDFICNDDEDPVTFDRVDPADAYNAMTISIKNRQNEYNDLPVDWRDQGLIDQYGIRPKDSMDAFEVCEPDMAAVMVALMGQRTAYIRNTFTFTLPPRFVLIEPMDILELTDVRLGTFSVRVTEIDEQDDDNFTIIAEEYAGPVGNSGTIGTPTTGNNPINTGVTAGDVNTPIFLQPPPSLTDYRPEIWAAVSGAAGVFDPLWGGCQVWISTDGDVSYNQVGTIDAPARMGVLDAAIVAYGGVNPDTVHTLTVDAAISEGEFFDATPVDAAAAVTLTYVAAEGANVEEFLSYENATLVTDFTYDLDNLYRGLYGSVAGAHALGAPFARLDTEAIFRYEFPLDMIGETIYVKFVSFNIWNDGYQDISTVTAYPVVPVAGYTYGVTVGDLTDVDSSSSGTGGAVDWVWDPGTGEYTITPAKFGFGFSQGDPVVSKPIAYADIGVAWRIPASLTGSQGTIGDSLTASATAPDAQLDFDIQSPPGSSIGTMRFAAASLTATFIKAALTDVPAGQPVVIVAPANLHNMHGKVYGSILGTRN